MKCLATLLCALPSAALAHPGDHSGLGMRHVLTQPDHLAMIVGAVVVAALTLYKLRSRS